MKLLILTIIQILGIVKIHTNDNKIIGQWQSEKEPKIHTEFYLAKDGFYYGKVIANNNQPENIGKIILKKISYDAATTSYTGTMTPPDKDLDLHVTIHFVNQDKIKVVAKKLFISKTLYFDRIKS